MRQDKIEVKEVELVPHMQTQMIDEFMLETIPSDIYTLRILYKENK